MNNLAASYNYLGRRHDALALHEQTLEFRRRVLPQNHPDVGQSSFNVSVCYHQAGDVHRAVERAREALRIWQAALPPSHPRVQMAQQRVHQMELSLARHA